MSQKPLSPSRAPSLRLAVDGRVLDDRYHGIGRITEALLRRLGERDDIELTIFLHPQQSSTRFDIDGIIAAGGMQRASFDLSLTSPRQWLAWPRSLRAAQVEAALFPYHLGAAVTGKVRRYAIVHDCILEAAESFAPGRWTRALYRLLTRVVVRRTHVLTPSRASAAEIARYYGSDVGDWQVIPWGVDHFFSGSPRQDSVAGVALPDHYYLHVGARRPHKNVPVLVRMLTLLPPDAHLVLVGTPDERWPDPVLPLALELGVADRILQFPRVTDEELAALYAGAQAFVYPSFIEGFGLPLLEAMAAGCPVVASDIPVFREVADSAALLVAPGDPAAWAAEVGRLADGGLRSRLTQAGRDRAAAADWSAAVDRLVTALHRVG